MEASWRVPDGGRSQSLRSSFSLSLWSRNLRFYCLELALQITPDKEAVKEINLPPQWVSGEVLDATGRPLSFSYKEVEIVQIDEAN